MIVEFVAVVRTLSSSSAGRSPSDGASEATVNVDCVESLEAFDTLLAFVLLAAGLCLWTLTSLKKGQSGDRLKCSSLLQSELYLKMQSQTLQTYSGLSDGSHPSRAKEQYVQVAVSSHSGVGVYFHPASTNYKSMSMVRLIQK